MLANLGDYLDPVWINLSLCNIHNFVEVVYDKTNLWINIKLFFISSKINQSKQILNVDPSLHKPKVWYWYVTVLFGHKQHAKDIGLVDSSKI